MNIKIIFCVLILFSFLSSIQSDILERHANTERAENDCYPVKCVPLGGMCDHRENRCNTTAYCNASNRCVPRKENGAPCKSAEECMSGYGCSSTKGCELYPSKRAGMSCMKDEECYWEDDDFTHLPSRCIDGLCFGRKVGAHCTHNAQCAGYTFCNEAKMCSNLLKNGERCTASPACEGTSYCHFDNIDDKAGVCRPLFQQPVGSGCYERWTCREGLYCSLAGICTVPPKSSNKSCLNEVECTPPEYCDCDYHSDKGTGNCEVYPFGTSPVGGVAAYKEYLSCAYQHLCDEEDLRCLLEKCKNPTCAFFKLVGVEDFLDRFPDCLLEDEDFLFRHVCGF